MKRKVLMLEGSGKFSVKKQDMESLKDYEVLVQVKASGISPGTELGGIKHMRANPAAFEWRPFGYQNSGVVIDKGPGVKDIEKGMRVACMGSGARHGSIAAVPGNLCIPLPESVSFPEAAFTNLAGTAIQAVRRAGIEFGENVLVMGLGILGNMIGQLAGACGAHVAGADFFPLRRKKAEKTGFEITFDTSDEKWTETCGAFASPFGFDCAFICFGGNATPAFENVSRLMKVSPDRHIMGRVVIPGGCEVTTRFGAAIGNLDIRSSARTGPGYHDDSYEQGGDYPKTFVPWTTRRNISEFYRAMESGRIKMKPVITHEFPLDRGPEACELLIGHPEKALGVVLRP